MTDEQETSVPKNGNRKALWKNRRANIKTGD